MSLQPHELKALAIEMAAALAPLPSIEDIQKGAKDRLNSASSDLEAARGMLIVLADYVDGEAESAVYGIETLIGLAKEKVDQTIEGRIS